MKKIFYIILFFFVTSCNNLEFVYKDDSNLLNPLYDNTEVSVSGEDLIFLKSYLSMLFGENKEEKYNLIIDINEKKTKRSVKTNQVTSNLRYELRFFYTLILNKDSCVTYEKEITSYFSIIPKSSGYNYGTDSSLEKKYELAISDNLNQFVSILSDKSIYNC